MTGHTEVILELEDSSDSIQPTRKGGFFARRQNRKKVRQRTEKLEEEIERAESAQERVAKARHPRRRRHTSPAKTQSSSLSKAATRSKSPDLVGNGPRRLDLEARKELRKDRGRREFLRQSAVGAGILALGAGLGYGSGSSQAQGLSGNGRTVITDLEIAARVIGGVRIATEFIPDPVPSGTDADPYPGSAIQAALNDGLHVYIPAGTWRLTSTITRPADGATIVGAGRSTKLVFNGLTPCISAGLASGWLIANLATDAGGIDVLSSSDSRITEIWVNGTLTDNRPRGTVSGGTGGHYGVRAADFITSGDGSNANPYNGSAIVDAINALPDRGGIVFVKSGVWRGPRIALGGLGQAGRDKKIIVMGEGCDMSGHNGADTTFHAGIVGTVIQCGFDIMTGGCQVDFHNCELSPGATLTNPVLKYFYDGTGGGPGFWQQGGFTIRNCRFMRGHPQLWVTGTNVSAADAVQHWNVVVDRCHFRLGGTAIKIDDNAGVAYNGIFRGSIRDVQIQANSMLVGGVAKRAVDVDIANLKGLWTNWLIEDSGGFGGAVPDYTMYIRTARAGPGFVLQAVDFGDRCNAPKEAYLEASIEGMTVRNFWFGGIFADPRTVDIRGFGDFEIGSYTPAGTVNVLAASHVVLRQPKGLVLNTGILTNPENILIIREAGAVGLIGSTTPAGSPYTYTNNDACVEAVYLVGGTVTDVSRNGQSLGAERVHYLAPGDAITISHTSGPSIKRFAVS